MLHVRTHSIPRRRSSELDETIRRYRAEIERLMPMLGAPAQWDAATLRDAFERRSKEIPGSTALLATIMRSYLRFLIGRGQCRPALLHAKIGRASCRERVCQYG